MTTIACSKEFSADTHDCPGREYIRYLTVEKFNCVVIRSSVLEVKHNDRVPGTSHVRSSNNVGSTEWKEPR